MLSSLNELGMLGLAAGAYRLSRSAGDVIKLSLIPYVSSFYSGIHGCPEYGK